MLVATAATVMVVVGVAVLGTHWGATKASAAQVRASLTQGLSAPRNIRGEFSVQTRPALPRPKPAHGCSNCKPPLPVPSAFVLGTDGSYSSRSLAPSTQFPASAAYDATADVMTQIGRLGGGLLYVRTTGNNPAYTSFRPESQLASWVLYALDSGDSHVSSTHSEGRDAWALTLDFAPGDDYYDTYGARVDVVVDKETGLLLKLTQYENDPSYWTSIETIHDLELDMPTSSADFALPIPANARVVRHDQGFEPVTRQQAAAIVGYAPLLPVDTGGRPLTRLAAAKKSTIAFLPGTDRARLPRRRHRALRQRPRRDHRLESARQPPRHRPRAHRSHDHDRPRPSRRRDRLRQQLTHRSRLPQQLLPGPRGRDRRSLRRRCSRGGGVAQPRVDTAGRLRRNDGGAEQLEKIVLNQHNVELPSLDGVAEHVVVALVAQLRCCVVR